MAKYLDPKADLTFKKVFGEHEDLLISFLNAVLPLNDGAEVETVEYLSPEMVPESPLKKFSIVDVRCKDNHNRQFIVEMQMCWTEDFLQRALFNTSKAFIRPLAKGEDYDELRQVYTISIINDIAFPNLKDEFYHRYIPTNVDHPEYTIKGYEMLFIELPKFRPSTVLDKKMMILWLRYLTEINEKTQVVPEELEENEFLSKAISIVEESAYTDAQRMAYEKFWDDISSWRTLTNGYFRQGHAEGHAEGRAEGRAEGIAIGEERGAEKERLANIARMRAKGYSDADIADLLELDKDYVSKH